ncbi:MULTISPECIES: DUF3307 domain-containing protein [unclassified Marinovum]
MSAEVLWLLGLIAGLQIKHLFADFLMQTRYMLDGKGRYGHPGGLAHAGVHGGMSFVLLALANVPLVAVAGLVLAEIVVHYHLDWGKERWCQKHRLGPTRPGFWRAFGADQTLHQLTYLAMAALALGAVG